MYKDLFFVNEIIQSNSNDDCILVLFKVPENEAIHFEESFSYSEDFIIAHKEISSLGIKEGNFVYKDGNSLLKANTDERAKREFSTNNLLRGNLIKKFQEPIQFIADIKRVYSYHIYVGHGNYSIIVIETPNSFKVWIVDCSEIDNSDHFRNYRNNIVTCIDHIKEKFNITSLTIDKLFITHPHFDHTNGINYLISQNYLQETEIWINFYYSWPESPYSTLLRRLDDLSDRLNLSFIEPKVQNSNMQVEILYPNRTILRTIPQNIRPYPDYSLAPGLKINNSSAIYKLNLANKSFLFPGDIETEGWNQVITCHPQFRNSNFYCISHHGSITGHNRNICPNGTLIRNIDHCCRNVNINILMGRNGAHNGIFSDAVLNSFNGRLYRTDLNNQGVQPRFLELDWDQEQVYYY